MEIVEQSELLFENQDVDYTQCDDVIIIEDKPTHVNADVLGPGNPRFELDLTDQDGIPSGQEDYVDFFDEESSVSAVDDTEYLVDFDIYHTHTVKQRRQLIQLRRHLDQLQENVAEKQFKVLHTGEKLDACHAKIMALNAELTTIQDDIKQTKEARNNGAYYRLISKQEKLDLELHKEYEVEALIRAELQIMAISLSEIALEQRHYMDLSEKLTQKEEKVNEEKELMADLRLRKEYHTTTQKQIRVKNEERQFLLQVEVEGNAYKEKIKDAIANNMKARQFLQMSLQPVKEQARQKEIYDVACAKQRMKSIVELKKSIALTQENLQALQARNAVQKRKIGAAEMRQHVQIMEDGGNPDQVLLQRKKLKEQNELRKAFTKKNKGNRIKIAAKILSEEERIEKHIQQQPQLFTRKTEKKKEVHLLRKKSFFHSIKTDCGGKPCFVKETPTTSVMENMGEKSSLDLQLVNDGQTAIKSDVLSSPLPLVGRHETLSVIVAGQPIEEDLAQPEFDGLWTKKHKDYEVPKDDQAIAKPIGGSNMEKGILKRTLERHRAGIFIKQIAAGREFTGQPFCSKPEMIHFQDFDLNKTYIKRVIITNVSYSMNFCKLIEISEHLKDFIHIDFKPPGQMSAGMSCDMNVTFTPKINKDLHGEIKFQAQTGPFSICLKCTTKKCDLCLDMDSIDFGSQVVGETICKSVYLINKGALGTSFEFFKVLDKAASTYTTETSLGHFTTSDSVVVTPVDESDLPNTCASYPPETTTKQQRKQNTKEEILRSAMTSIRPSETPLFPVMEDRDCIRATNVEVEDEDWKTGRHNIKSVGDEIKFASTVTGYSMLPEEIKVGQVMSGEIAAFSSIRLDIIFAPTIPGNIKASFMITFSDKGSSPLTVKTFAKAIDVPVWIENPTINLGICMYDRLYQDQLIVKNRSSTALRLNFEVPKELRSHVELLPKTGYIQAHSTFTAQLKFLPRPAIAEEGAGLFDPGSGVLEAPMAIQVADQARPVPFTVMGIVTCSDMQFDQVEIDFGNCGIFESVTRTIRLTNHSILPQKFGFVNVPDYAEVQPNDGFGVILPLETVELNVIMIAHKAQSYDFKLVCKNIIGRQFSIRCRAVGIHPPLEFTKQVINFSATALGDTTSANFHVVNSHISANEFTHPVPRIGKGAIVPVGPTSFEFLIPENSPVSLAPSVGTIKPGEKCLVNVHYNPEPSEKLILEEATKVLRIQKDCDDKKKEADQLTRDQALTSVEDDNNSKGRKLKTPARTKTSDSQPTKSSETSGNEKKSQNESKFSTPLPEVKEKDCNTFKAANASLMRTFTGSFCSFKIPCFISTGSCDDVNNPPSSSFHSANILYLEVHCPIVKPPVVVISNHGQNCTDFGQVSIGQSAIQPISIQNICDLPVNLTLSCLDPNGPFLVLNALRTLAPDETHTLLVSFTPNAGRLFHEVLKVMSSTASLNISLAGEGVSPVINISVENSILNVGDVLEGESITTSFMLSNSSSLKVNYSIQLDSNSLMKHSFSHNLPNYMLKNIEEKPHKHMLAGLRNYDSSPVFDCIPCEGTIRTGESHDIKVTFSPDHSSRHFTDGARIVLFNLAQTHVLKLCGQAHRHMMYIDGYNSLVLNEKSLTTEKKPDDPESDSQEKSILLTFQSKVQEGAFQPSTRQLIIGCLKTNAFAGKKNGEWILENMQHAQSLGFSVEQPKGSVDIGSTKPLEFVWAPTEIQDPNTPVESSVKLTLKADVTLTFNVLLRALLVMH